jgi:hypothetical protein
VIDSELDHTNDIEYEDDQKGIDKTTVNEVSIGLNRIYGHNGESYYIPINAAQA